MHVGYSQRQQVSRHWLGLHKDTDVAGVYKKSVKDSNFYDIFHLEYFLT